MGWKVQGSNAGGGKIFCTHPDQPWSTMSTRSLPPRGNHPPPSSAEVNKRVQMYLYSPSGFSWPVVG